MRRLAPYAGLALTLLGLLLAGLLLAAPRL